MLLLLVLSSVLAVGGCVTESAKPVSQGGTPAQLSGFDACSANMQDLSGYLLQYYVINHHRLPPTLEALRPLVDVDRQLPLACPVSGKPYLYFPNGLVASGEQKRLLLADPTPAHNGKRWAIVTLPAGGSTPLGLWVVQLDESAFQKFHTP